MKKVGIIIPAYNEEKMIRQSVSLLNEFLLKNMSQIEAMVYVIDNASKDKTAEEIKDLVDGKRIQYLYEPVQGKGAAIRHGMLKSIVDGCETVCFMDADMATDLKSLPLVIEDCKTGAAFGDRYHNLSVVKRSAKRLLVSRAYRILAKTILNSKISDFPCGFKAFSAGALKTCLPKVENNSWFFDSELAYLIEKHGFEIKNIPVKWEDVRPSGEKSKVNIIKVSLQYLKELLRLRRGRFEV